MILKRHMFRKVTVIGIGFMGGSFGLALKKNNLAKEVVGLSRRQSSLVQAIKKKAIDHGTMDTKKAVKNTDLVVFATPVESIIKLLEVINPHLKRRCLITDLGSTKVGIVDAAQRILTNPGNFIGSHPLAGSEKKGIDFAVDNLFEGAQCIVTPTVKTHQVAKEKIKHMWKVMGANVEFLSAELHDEVLSYISHLPHLVAYGLIGVIPNQFLQYAPKGLKDTTRIASSTAEVWKEICLANSKNIVNCLDEYVQMLANIRTAIANKDEEALNTYFNTAKQKRDSISGE